MLEINDTFSHALDLMENSDKNLFVTGRAGTGKSTLLNHFKTTTKKRVAVIAPTGVAAVNVNGQTIHSFFGFKPNTTLRDIKKLKNHKMYQALDTLIIDEISMVRADLFDCIDKALKLNRNNPFTPFGGTQILMFGDLHQLPPIVTDGEHTHFSTHYQSPYFFDSHSYANLNPEIIELNQVYRQKDPEFVNLLDAIRHNQLTPDQLTKLNQQVKPNFTPTENDPHIHLCTLNKMADEINNQQLEKIPSLLYCFNAEKTGNYNPEYMPNEQKLKLKQNAQVMFLNNDNEKKWVNGTIGKILNIQTENGNYAIHVQLNNKTKVKVHPHTWELFKPKHNPAKNTLEYETIGTFTQYPLRLAWAITIHKSQGKTFEKTIIDFGNGTFAPGQAYVALSRCTTLQNMILKKPLQTKYLMTDEKIENYLEKTKKENTGPALIDS